MIDPWNILGWLVLILISLPLAALILYLTIRGLTRLILIICTSLHIPCDRLDDFYETM
jgi:hypothetical protein